MKGRAPGGFGANGSFYDKTTVALPRSQATPVPLGTTDFGNEVSIEDGTKITFATTGKFNIVFSLQLEKGDGGTDIVSVWLSKNGTNNRHLVALVVMFGRFGRRSDLIPYGPFLMVGTMVAMAVSAHNISLRSRETLRENEEPVADCSVDRFFRSVPPMIGGKFD